MNRTAPASLSVYRGQSRRGIGEGPGRPIAHGEQYLGASQSLVNSELLDTIRHWMTLDSDPADHQRLNDRLESWSCFRWRHLRFVVRLVSAGIYDRRAAYFSHGRAWSLETSLPGFDPGLHLGCSEAFEQPWRDDEQGQRVTPEPFPVLVRPGQLAEECQVAARFLAHLYQSCLRSRPLIIAVPVAAFAVGSALHTLVSFARGALPRELRDGCDVRVYTRTPDLFLGQLKARLIVVPEDVAGSALGVRRDATLLDREGNPLAGGAAEKAALDYAEAVVERAIKIPEGLPLFSERFQARHVQSGLPDPGEVRSIQVIYNLAVAFAGSEAERGDLVCGYLPRIAQKLGPGLSWDRLVDAREWGSFPQDAVLGLVFQEPGNLSPGGRELQEAVERAVARLSWNLEPALRDWWGGAGARPEALRRLLQLKQAALISEAALVERTSEMPLSGLEELGMAALLPILDAELRHGSLARRMEETDELGKLASRPEVAALIVREGKALDPVAQLGTFLCLAGILEEAGDLGHLEELASRLDRSALSGLARRAVRPDDLKKVFHLVDRRMIRDPASATEALVRSGWWFAWRWDSRLQAEDLATAAVAWMSMPWWSDQEATLEAWKMALSDLPKELSEEQMGAICGGGRSVRPWPWIPPFEEDQVDALIERAADLGALARLAEALRSDDFLFSRQGLSSHRYVLRRTRLTNELPDGALGWLVDPRCSSPVLSLEQASFLLEHAGGRRDGALRACVFSVANNLRTSRVIEALRMAESLGLWEEPVFMTDLAGWIWRERATDVYRRLQTVAVAQGLVDELARRGFGGGSSAPSQIVPAPKEPKTLTDAILQALAETRESDAPCWSKLEQCLAPGRRDPEEIHPLSDVAWKIRYARYGSLGYGAWETFEKASSLRGVLLGHDSGPSVPLPAFELAASLLPEGSLGNAAQLVIFASGSSGYRGEPNWWRALFCTIRGWSRKDGIESGDDDQETAIALIASSLDQLEADERDAFWRALKLEYRSCPTWGIPAAFGVRPQ